MAFSESAVALDEARVGADRQTLRDMLRGATAADHAALDHMLVGHDLAEREHLVRFLGIHFAARVGVEDWLERNCPPDWSPPPQTALIADDLAALGGCAGSYPPPDFDPEPAADWLGPAYVIAGSHLGNRLLLAQAGQALPAEARRFLSGSAMQNYWRRLRTLLSETPGPDGGQASAMGARATFAHFARCVERFECVNAAPA